MVGRTPRGRARRAPVSGSHHRCWLWGRHLVEETLAARRWPILELWLADDLPDADRLASQAGQQGCRVKIVSRAKLAARCPREDHQGYLAMMPPFPYVDADTVLAPTPTHPLYLVLDAIQDPFNFGAILRSAEVFGIDAVFVGTDRQADVTPHVARSSAGAINHVTISRGELLPIASRLRSHGIRIVGASERGTLPIGEFDFRPPAAIVIGNESQGIRPELLPACETLIRIPQYGSINSLNAAAAAAVICYEARRQRGHS